MKTIQAHTPAESGRIPVRWLDDDLLSAFSAYLETPAESNSRHAEWVLFGLSQTASLARLVPHFDDLLALEHVQGFIPLPYQVDTARRVVQELRGRAILADEVGLGKTIEAGLVIKEYLLRGLASKVLILVPSSLVLQWTRELQDKFRIACHAQREAWAWSQYDIIVASLDTAKREPHKSQILQTSWDLLVIDEAHKLKNHRTRNWDMVNRIPTKFMLLLTATPMQNGLRELQTLVNLLRPGQLESTNRHASALHATEGENGDVAPDLKSSLHAVMIRNRRRDGGATLPKRQVSVVSLELTPEERHLYDEVQEYLRTDYADRRERNVSVLPLITLQREICSSPYAAMVTMDKMLRRALSVNHQQRLAELLTMAQSVGLSSKVETVLNLLERHDEKCVIFTEYRATQDLLLYMLKKRGIQALPFRGGFKRSKKDWMQDLFSRKTRVLVATESGGEGINLQFCRHMINFDLPWNPMRLEQRIGRIHRLGQTSDVEVYNLSTRATIEEHIVALLQEKIKLFEAVIGELDDIVLGAGQTFEETVFDWAMTSHSDAEFRDRMHHFGTELLRRYDAEGHP